MAVKLGTKTDMSEIHIQNVTLASNEGEIKHSEHDAPLQKM